MPKLCQASEIPDDASRGFELENLRICAVRRDGILYLYENLCPHLSLPLEWQPDQFLDSEGSYIQCSTHGALFEISSGECVAGPCEGDALRPVDYRMEEGWVMID